MHRDLRPRIGRWEVTESGTVRLIGSRCSGCYEVFFPDRAVCGKCGSSEMVELRLDGFARLVNYTIVHQLPAGFTAPLVLGYGELDGGVLVLAPIDARPDEVTVGMPLIIHLGVTWIDEGGEPLTSYRFAPAVASEGS